MVSSSPSRLRRSTVSCPPVRAEGWRAPGLRRAGSPAFLGALIGRPPRPLSKRGRHFGPIAASSTRRSGERLLRLRRLGLNATNLSPTWAAGRSADGPATLRPATPVRPEPAGNRIPTPHHERLELRPRMSRDGVSIGEVLGAGISFLVMREDQRAKRFNPENQMIDSRAADGIARAHD